ncbi:DUF4861 family protein [Litorimonas sp.]|uniref:DUF4861 family protein n=1 Tax=Litorimonas sp. TaxID=1892381 RepID=UPI003A88CFD9
MIALKRPLLMMSLTVLAACAQTPDPEEKILQTDRVAADIGDLTQDGQSVAKLQTPPGFKQGDKLVTYEGPGWESDKVGFRLYLDNRNALDIFGKKTDGLILKSVGRGEDYHEMSDWGMDILKVNNSLGAGGLGVYENETVRQIGKAESYSAEIIKDSLTQASIRVTHTQSEACENDVSATYSIQAGQRLSRINVQNSCVLPYAAGLIIHPNTSSIISEDTGAWRYKARYGVQSLVPDSLGLALFYRAEDITLAGADEDDDYIVFKPSVAPDYFTAAAWEQEKGGLKTKQAFTEWLEETQARLNKTYP